MLRAFAVLKGKGASNDSVTLTYEDRFKRRVVLHTDLGIEFLLDLPTVTDLQHGDLLELENGALVEVIAAPEDLLEIRGADTRSLVRLTWHIGNRHLACMIEDDRLLVRPDHVIQHMIEHLGGRTSLVQEPFMPEGGAYGRGRTHSHDH